jgi:hypothetical protein
MSKSVKRSRDAESRDESDSYVVTLRNKLQRSDCTDVGSSYNKLMLQDILTTTPATPTRPTQQHTTQQHTIPTSNSDTQTWRTPTASIPTPTLTPNYRNYHNHKRQHHATTPQAQVVATATDVALLIKELLELCGSNYNYHNYSHDNTDNNKDSWKQTRDKLWLLGEAAYQSEGQRDAVGRTGGCLVVTQCLSTAVQAATDMQNMHTTATAFDPSLLSTLLTVQEAACFCLTNLTYRHPANRHRLMAAGGASVLVAVLQYIGPMHHGTAATASSTDGSGGGTISSSVGSQVGTVLSRACMVLDNLAASESCQERIVQADVIEAVCATMLAFPDTRELLFSGCRILGRLAESCQNGKQQHQHQHQQQVRLRAVRVNGVVAVARAFERFCQTDAATARMASAALQCLTALWSEGNHAPDTERAS